VKAVQLVGIDLDGTLLDNDNRISPRAREAIRQVRGEGVAVTLCTGRMFASARPYALELELDIPLVTYQGALVKSSLSQEVLYQRFLPLELAARIVELARKLRLQVNCYYGDRLYVEGYTPLTRQYAARAGVKLNLVGDLLAFMDEDPIKLVALGSDQSLLGRLEELVQKEVGDRVYITRSQPEYLEFTHPQATKADGLKAVTRRLGFDLERVMVIGDSFNDLAMFDCAGLPVAMGNAPLEVQARARWVTAKNEDDGVAQALEELILKGGYARV